MHLFAENPEIKDKWDKIKDSVLGDGGKWKRSGQSEPQPPPKSLPPDVVIRKACQADTLGKRVHRFGVYRAV
jgi:hypothetical protein